MARATTGRAKRGHNSGENALEHATGGSGSERLRTIIERIERLEEERKALSSDIKDIYTEAKSAGYDVQTLRQIIRERAAEPEIVEERQTLLDIYRGALGMIRV